MVTYNRDAVLSASLERLNRLPYLNRVIVVWNNIDRKPQDAWPRLHVPLVFVNATRNSLNNRFLPYDQIQTEAVLSMDDDIDLKQHEIVFAFRCLSCLQCPLSTNLSAYGESSVTRLWVSPLGTTLVTATASSTTATTLASSA